MGYLQKHERGVVLLRFGLMCIATTSLNEDKRREGRLNDGAKGDGEGKEER